MGYNNILLVLILLFFGLFLYYFKRKNKTKTILKGCLKRKGEKSKKKRVRFNLIPKVVDITNSYD